MKFLSAFYIGFEVRGLFIDVSKVFDKTWHAGLIYKLRQNGICGNQRVVLNGHQLLLFLIYVNDLPNGLKSKRKLFADDTSLFSVVHDISTSASNTNHDSTLISNWPFQ